MWARSPILYDQPKQKLKEIAEAEFVPFPAIFAILMLVAGGCRQGDCALFAMLYLLFAYVPLKLDAVPAIDFNLYKVICFF